MTKSTSAVQQCDRCHRINLCHALGHRMLCISDWLAAWTLKKGQKAA